jgi:nucleotide-binding universal stress UspA family protein
MATFDTPPVLLVVASDSDYDAALAFAAEEAVRADCGLHLLHVVHAYPMSPAEAMIGSDGMADAGRELLAEAATRAEALLDGRAPVTRELVEGPVVGSIVERSEVGRVVVLQRRHLGRAERLLTGSISNGVASRAHVPVVSVPAGWSATSTVRNLVTVGVEDPATATEVVRAGLREGARRSATVRLLHCWWFIEPYDDAVFTDDKVRAENKRADARVREALGPLTAEAPGVEVDVRVRHRRPADQLVEESQHSRLLVVGRRDPRIPFGSHLGPVAKAVLREASCPVMVVGPGARRGAGAGSDDQSALLAGGAPPA